MELYLGTAEAVFSLSSQRLLVFRCCVPTLDKPPWDSFSLDRIQSSQLESKYLEAVHVRFSLLQERDSWLCARLNLVSALTRLDDNLVSLKPS